MTKEAMKLAKSTGLIERLYYKGTTPEDTDAILRFYDACLAHAKAACVNVCEQTDEDGEGPDQWDWHAKDYASALREALDHIANGGKMIEQPAQQEPVAAAKKDAVFTASIEFIGTLTGMQPPPIEVAPPEIFKPFRDFTEKVCSIFAAPQPAQQQPVPWSQALEDVWAIALHLEDVSAEQPVQYSDIISDGGMDPRNKFDKPAQQEPVQYKCMVIDNHHQNAIPFEQWVKPPAQRKPLTREQVRETMTEAGYDTASPQERADFIKGIRHGEAAHDIKENT